MYYVEQFCCSGKEELRRSQGRLVAASCTALRPVCGRDFSEEPPAWVFLCFSHHCRHVRKHWATFYVQFCRAKSLLSTNLTIRPFFTLYSDVSIHFLSHESGLTSGWGVAWATMSCVHAGALKMKPVLSPWKLSAFVGKGDALWQPFSLLPSI